MNHVKCCNMKLLVVFFYQSHLKTLLFKHAGNHVLGKGKAIPLQAWTGPEGSRSLRLPDFKTIGT